MKKFYLLSLFLCLGMRLFAGQVTIYATGATGSYITGSASNTTRTDDNLAVVPNFQRAYAVFDLASNLPPGAVITSVSVGFNIINVTGSGPAGSTIKGYNGDLSTITVPGTLYTTMGAATTYYGTTWGTSTGPVFIPSNGGAVTFMQNSFNGGAGTGLASLIWTITGGGPGHIYDITGETGGTDAPYIVIDYNCPGLTVSAGTTTSPTSPICPNTTFSLTGVATGASSYAWAGPSGYTSTQLSPTITGGIPSFGVYTLTAYTASGCYDKALAFPNMHPAPYNFINVLNYSAFCPGDFSQLEGPVPFGVTYDYQWYDNGVAIPGATDAQYNSTTSASLTLMTTDQNTGCSATTQVPVKVMLFDVPATLNPGGTLHLCPGSNGGLAVDVNGVTNDISYQWQKNNVDIIGANTNGYTVSTSGYYRVIMEVVANGCRDTSLVDTVIVNASPSPTITMAGGALHAAASYATYQWFLNTVAVAGATSATIVPTANGSYRVKVTDMTGCSGYSNSFSFVSVGVGQLNMQGVNIYPNPAHSLLHIESPVAVKAVITGLEGRQWLQSGAADLDISRLANGIYLISLYSETGERIAVQQFIKE